MRTKWTVMVYMAADESLANFAIESLKQLRALGDHNVAVAVQFDADGASEGRLVRRFIFNGSNPAAPLDAINNQYWPDEKPPRDCPMTEVTALTEFVDWVYRECQADHYCLVLWGHGPELLFELPVTKKKAGSQGNGKNVRLYFTPSQLRQALAKVENKTEKGRLKVIAMDACSMSTVEYAYELRHQADFMIASQEEVPDPSFPYIDLKKMLCSKPEPEKLCTEIMDQYRQAYQFYICTARSGQQAVGLSVLSLKEFRESEASIQEAIQINDPRIATSIRGLVTALQQAANHPEGRKAIYDARKNSQGFVGGAFVDIIDFCEKLRWRDDRYWSEPCDKVKKAVESCIVSSWSSPDLKRSNGLSIYFPYLNDDGPALNDLVTGKGIPRLVDKDMTSEVEAQYRAMNDVAKSVIYTVHREIIKDTEHYYQDHRLPLQFAKDSHWYEFIKGTWSLILAGEAVEAKDLSQLDHWYSAQQCAENLLAVAQQEA